MSSSEKHIIKKYVKTDLGPSTAPVVPALDRLFVQLDDLNVRMQQLVAMQQNQIPEGINEADTITINPPGIILDAFDGPTNVNTRLKGPWMSLTLTNDGPGDVSVMINYNEAYKDTVKSSESKTIDMHVRGKIHHVELQVTASTTVRIAAVR